MKENYFWIYKIQFYDDIDSEMKIAQGIATGGTFSEVVKKVEKYYGTRELNRIFDIDCICEGNILDLEALDEFNKRVKITIDE